MPLLATSLRALSGLITIVVVLFEDSLEEEGRPFLNYIVNNHVNSNKYEINYFVYEGLFQRTAKKYEDTNVKLHDCVSNVCRWKNPYTKEIMDAVAAGTIAVCPCECNIKENLLAEFTSNQSNQLCVIVIDSLAHLIYNFGVREVYQMIQNLKRNKRK